MIPYNPERLRNEIAFVAERNIGYGEQGGNNIGPFLEAIGATPGHEWCAYFVRYCVRRAAQRLDMVLPGNYIGSASAKRNGTALARISGAVTFTDPERLVPGDVFVVHRGINPFKGHTGIVLQHEDGITHTIEGNVGKYPARVRVLTHDFSKERLAFFVGLR